MSSRLIEEEFDELVVYVAGLKKTFSRRLDDHLFIIQQQNQRLDDQTRLIDELAWQIRDLRASVRSVEQNVLREHPNGKRGPVPRNPNSCDYANMSAKTDSTKEELAIIRPRIQNEKIIERVEILNKDEYPRNSTDTFNVKSPRSTFRSGNDKGEPIYEPIQFTERNYTGKSVPSSSSLSAQHRKTKQQQPLPPIPDDINSSNADGRTKRTDQQFHFPPPPPLDVFKSAPGSEDGSGNLVLRPTTDYPQVQITKRIRNGTNPETSSPALTIVRETAEDDGDSDEQEVEDFLRRIDLGDREANSIRRRTYILPTKGPRM